MPRARDQLPARHARGRDAEALVARDLEARGFRLLWRNLRIGALELDIIAAKEDLVVIVEVRARAIGALVGPLSSISLTKKRALLRASRGLWRGRLSKMSDVGRVRIDVAAVTYDATGTPTLEWVCGAITEQDG
jgi:putative endonuclease